MPVTLQPTTLKYKDDNGNWQHVSCLKGEDVSSRLLAPDYSDLTFPVVAGTLCMHSDVLYSAKQDIATLETWTSAHWDEVYVSNAINKKIDKTEIGTVPEGSTVEGQISALNESITLIQSMIADAESSATAAHAHAVKTVFILNNKLLMALSAIAVGDTITTTGNSPNAAEVTLADAFPHDVQVNGTSVVTDGVANVPMAGSTTPGVVIVRNGNEGLYINALDRLSIIPATADQVKAADNNYRIITPLRQHNAVFYGLAKAAGADMASVSGATVGVYPEAQKSAIDQMLNAPETVSGSTPSITAKSGVRYVCGECSTLSITPPQSGCIDVVFTSGSTPTVLTLPNTVKFPDAFDPSNLDANTTYEINILNGVYGLVSSWT